VADKGQNSRMAYLRFAVLLTLATTAGFAQVPEKPDVGHAALGRGLYRSYCASCHGKEGKGDGPIAEYLVVAPSDLTRLTGDDGRFPFDEVTKKIDGREQVATHGSPDMPIWGEVFQEAESGGGEEKVHGKIQALAHYLWSIQAAPDEH